MHQQSDNFILSLILHKNIEDKIVLNSTQCIHTDAHCVVRVKGNDDRNIKLSS